MSRLAGHYGMNPAAALPWWTWTGSQPRDESGPRDDAEVLLSPAGRQLLAQLGGVSEHDLARALPALNDEPQSGTPDRTGETAESGRPAGRWKVASAGPHGPVAYGCALCTAARTGRDAVVVRYVAPWHRVCARHQRWMLTAGDGHRHRNLDLRAAPEVAAAQRAWPKVARTAAAAGTDPGRVFALSHAAVCAWWEQALQWHLAGPPACGCRWGCRAAVLVVADHRPRRGCLPRDGGARARAARLRHAGADLGGPRGGRAGAPVPAGRGVLPRIGGTAGAALAGRRWPGPAARTGAGRAAARRAAVGLHGRVHPRPPWEAGSPWVRAGPVVAARRPPPRLGPGPTARPGRTGRGRAPRRCGRHFPAGRRRFADSRRLFRDRYGRAGAAYYRPGDGFDPGAGPAGQGDGRGRGLH